ncbi:hypothetical protein C5B91_15565 [Haloferax sp. Atlit-10N]|uniref:DUF6544 family protein n=1 Tax=unclassified Haloferax TaxID=2625095 RepID=UPI000E24A854|nr:MULTISPECIES: DUF6544 family protein [unclassified Haloferax]RDZ42508.1 hypothetical protein C5B87_16395 [Haloferax sp. Atlit-16N]RDZ57381.1 hypothetical protein C5B91_15565 [Haloferax sp. Atlit-10N]
MSRTRTPGRLGIAIVVGVLAVGALLAAVRARTDGTAARLLDVLQREHAETTTDDTENGETLDEADLSGLPAPVRRYLERVLPGEPRRVQSVRLRQTGAFRLGDADSPWKPMTATQHYTVDPPGFVWDARIDLAPFLPIRVVDAFVGGAGSLEAKLLSVVTVADAPPSPELDEGELARYLAEMVWFPTAFLPGHGVRWEPRDDRSARATLEYRGSTATVVFHFDENDEVVRVTADRWRDTGDGEYERCPWTGYFSDYREVDGMRVPTAAEVAWNLPPGDLPYWRATIDDAEYGPLPTATRRSNTSLSPNPE